MAYMFFFEEEKPCFFFAAAQARPQTHINLQMHINFFILLISVIK